MNTLIKTTLAVLWLIPASVAIPKSDAQLWPRVPEILELPLANDLLQATVHRLDNGLTIYLSPNHQEPRVAAWIMVRAGGKHDPSFSTGMAHYLEHMLFKGSTSLGTLDHSKEQPHLDRILALYEKLFETTKPDERKKIYKEIDAENIKATTYAIPNEMDKAYRQMGFNSVNAFTGQEYTAYVCNFPANRAAAWATLEADRFAHPVFRLFQTEIETVYEEKNRSLDNAGRIINEALAKQLYKVHPYGQQTVLGSIEHLKNPSLKNMYAYYDKHYLPNNMAIALAGNFDRKEMLALLQMYFGAWKANPLPKPRRWDLPKPKGVERVEVKYEAEERVIIAWPLVHNRHPDADALTVMDMIMDNSVAGIINLTLNQAQKVKQAGSYPSLNNDAGAWYLWAVTKKGQTLEEAEALLLETVDKLKGGEFTDEDIRAVITNFEVGEKRRLESNSSRVSMMASSFWSFETWPRTAGRLDRLRQITKDDILQVARKYLAGDRVVAFRRDAKPDLPSITKPEFTKVDIDTSRQSDFFKELVSMPAKPLEPRWLVEGRDYTATEYPWGKLYAAPNPVNDLFALSFGFRIGTSHDRELGAAMDLLDLSGGGELSAEEFKKKLYSLGTSFSYGSAERWVSVSISGLEKNLWPSLELLFSRFNSPNIADDTLEKMIEVKIGAHQDNKKNPRYIHHALSEFARRGQESRVLNDLNDQELKALKTGRLTPLLSKLWRYKRNVWYVGARSPGEIAKLIDDGRRKYKNPPASKSVQYLRPSRTRVLFTHRDMVQSQVGIFAADEVLDPEHAVDYQYYGSYMGGGMSAVIFQEIREARALAYSAWGGYSSGRWRGDDNQVYGQLGCQADKTIEATELLHELLHKPPLSEERFAETAKAIEEGYRTNPIRFRNIPFTVLRWEEQGITGGDPRPERFEKALKYKLAELENFAQRFKDKPMTIYILGHRDRVDLERLKGTGDFEEKSLQAIFPY